MSRIAGATWRWLRRSGLWLLAGILLAWIAFNAIAGPGVTVTGQEEAEGPQFSDPRTLDLVSEVHRRRVCPAQTQRWVWRWTTYRGRRAQQAVPLASTEMPFLADDGTFILTIPAGAVPDAEDGGWMFRSVTEERCPFLPTWLGWFDGVFGPRMYRSPDQPVNFVGEPHGGTAP